MGIAEELPEPVRLRSAEAEEHRGISEFQAELVQLGAALDGDPATEAYETDKLIDRMTVAEAADYCERAFARFREECQRCHDCGMDDSYIPEVQPAAPPAAPAPPASKLCICFPCFRA